jgi:large subunit ribosomal protein L25
MSEHILNARLREKMPAAAMNTERKNGSIAAVVYGHGAKNQTLWVERLAFEKLYQKAGESSLVELTVGKQKINVLIQDLSFDPLSHRATHIDFLQVQMNETLEARIPLEFVGIAPAVRELGGTLIKTAEEVEVTCLPKDIPHALAVDLSSLQTFEDNLRVSDIVVPAGVTILTQGDMVVATVEAPRSAEELDALNEKVEGDVTKVEGVIKADPDSK